MDASHCDTCQHGSQARTCLALTASCLDTSFVASSLQMRLWMDCSSFSLTDTLPEVDNAELTEPPPSSSPSASPPWFSLKNVSQTIWQYFLSLNAPVHLTHTSRLCAPGSIPFMHRPTFFHNSSFSGCDSSDKYVVARRRASFTLS